MSARRTIGNVFVLALGVSAAAGMASPSTSSAAQQPSPFQFDIQEITLKFQDRVVLHDDFRRAGVLRPTEIGGRRVGNDGPAYAVELGKIPTGNVRDGALRVDQNSTTNVWLGPKGTFGHRLHHHDVFITLVTVPTRLSGESSFVAADALPLEFTIRLRKPRFSGFEKLKIGLLDIEAFKNVAAVGIGRVPMIRTAAGGNEMAHGSPARNGAAATTLNVRDVIASPSVTLNRVEEPDILGEIVLARAALPSAQPDSVEMTLRVDAEGRTSAVARSFEGDRVSDLIFESLPQGHGRRLSPLSPSTKLSATLYVETLPKPMVSRVAPSELVADEIRRTDKVRLRIEGMGFGADTRVEMVPETAHGTAIAADALELQRETGGPEGTVLFADIGLRGAPADTYSLRLISGGQTTILRKAVRIF
jgi:hypothetical protein